MVRDVGPVILPGPADDDYRRALARRQELEIEQARQHHLKQLAKQLAKQFAGILPGTPEWRELELAIKKHKSAFEEQAGSRKQSSAAWQKETPEIAQGIRKMAYDAIESYEAYPEYPFSNNFKDHGDDKEKAAQRRTVWASYVNQAIALYLWKELQELKKLDITDKPEFREMQHYVNMLEAKLGERADLDRDATECKRQAGLAEFRMAHSLECGKESAAHSASIQNLPDTVGTHYLWRPLRAAEVEGYSKQAKERIEELEDRLADVKGRQRGTGVRNELHMNQAIKRSNADEYAVIRIHTLNAYRKAHELRIKESQTLKTGRRDILDNIRSSGSDYYKRLADEIIRANSVDDNMRSKILDIHGFHGGIVKAIKYRAEQARVRAETSKSRAEEARIRAEEAKAYNDNNIREELSRNVERYAEDVTETEKKVFEIDSLIAFNSNKIENEYNNIYVYINEIQTIIGATDIDAEIKAKKLAELAEGVEKAEMARNTAIYQEIKNVEREEELLKEIKDKLEKELEALEKERPNAQRIRDLANDDINTLQNLEAGQRGLEEIIGGRPAEGVVGGPGYRTAVVGLIQLERALDHHIRTIHDDILNKQNIAVSKNQERICQNAIQDARTRFWMQLRNVSRAEEAAAEVLKRNTIHIGRNATDDINQAVECVRKIKDGFTDLDNDGLKKRSEAHIFLDPQVGKFSINGVWMSVREVERWDFSVPGQTTLEYRPDMAKIEVETITREAQGGKQSVEPIYTKRLTERHYRSADFEFFLKVPGQSFADGGRREGEVTIIDLKKQEGKTEKKLPLQAKSARTLTEEALAEEFITKGDFVRNEGEKARDALRRCVDEAATRLAVARADRDAAAKRAADAADFSDAAQIDARDADAAYAAQAAIAAQAAAVANDAITTDAYYAQDTGAAQYAADAFAAFHAEQADAVDADAEQAAKAAKAADAEKAAADTAADRAIKDAAVTAAEDEVRRFANISGTVTEGGAVAETAVNATGGAAQVALKVLETEDSYAPAEGVAQVINSLIRALDRTTVANIFSASAEWTEDEYTTVKTFDMQAVSKIKIKENHNNQSNNVEVTVSVDTETMPNPVINHVSALQFKQWPAFTDEEKRRMCKINLDRQTVILPNGHEYPIKAFDWTETKWDEDNGLSLQFKGPRELSVLNFNASSSDSCNEKLSNDPAALKEKIRKQSEAILESLEQALKSGDVREIYNEIGTAQCSKAMLADEMNRVKIELMRPPKNARDLDKLKRKKKAQRDAPKPKSVAHSILNTAGMFENEAEKRIRAINKDNPLSATDVWRSRANPGRYALVKHKSSKEKQKLCDEIRAAAHLDKSLSFQLRVDPRLGPVSAIKNAAPNALELLQEYIRYKDYVLYLRKRKDFVNEQELQNVTQYVEAMAAEFRTNSNISVYYTNRWYLEQAMIAADNDNFLGQQGRGPGVIECLRSLKQVDLPPISDKSLASLWQADEYRLVTDLRDALAEADREGQFEWLRGAVTAAKWRQKSRDSNLELAERALDPETPSEQAEEILDDMQTSRIPVPWPEVDEKPAVSEDQKSDRKIDPKAITKKSEGELAEDAGKIAEEICKNAFDAVDNLIASTIDPVLQKKYREEAIRIAMDIAKQAFDINKQDKEMQNQWRKLEELVRTMDSQRWKDLVKELWLIWLKTSVEGASKGVQKFMDEFLKVVGKSIA